jgi:hypothetical protein
MIDLYDRLLDGVDDNSYNHDTEMQMVTRGKHYDEKQAVKAVRSIISGLRHQANTLEALLTGMEDTQ